MENKRQTAIDILNAIISMSDDDSNLSKKLMFNVSVDGTYAGTAVTPDTKTYSLASHPEDYAGDYEHEEEVYIEEMEFPCYNIECTRSNLIVDCYDPIVAKTQKMPPLSQISQIARSIKDTSIVAAFIRIAGANSKKIAYAEVGEFEPNASTSKDNAVKAGNIALSQELDLNYSPVVDYLAQQKCNAELEYSRNMKLLGSRFYNEDVASPSVFHSYRIRFYTKQNAGRSNVIDINASNVEDAIKSFNEQVAAEYPRQDAVEVISITCDGQPMSKSIVDQMNASYVDECDGGGAATGGGDAGGAGAADGAASGDVAAEMNGTSTADVLGTCKPGEGYMGKDNFYIPARAKVPLHRWEAANGGSRRKKGKNGKPKKYEYEKDAKVVVKMFEDESMLNEWGSDLYGKMHGKDWDEVKEEAERKARAKGETFSIHPLREQWEAAQLPAPDEAAHGKLGGCTIDEDQYKRAQYLKQYFIHGIYADGEMLEVGPVSRAVASQYVSMHKLSVNAKAFQDMKDAGFKGVQDIGDGSGEHIIIKMKDGFWLYALDGDHSATSSLLGCMQCQRVLRCRSWQKLTKKLKVNTSSIRHLHSAMR